MSSSKDKLAEEIDRLRFAEKDLANYLARLEKEKSDLLYSNKLIAQNLKYMTRRNSIPVVEEFEKQKKQRKLNEDRVSKIDEILEKSSRVLSKIRSELADKIESLKIKEEAEKPKVLEFKRRPK